MGHLKFLSRNFKSLRTQQQKRTKTDMGLRRKNYRSNLSAGSEHKSHDQNLTEEELSKINVGLRRNQ